MSIRKRAWLRIPLALGLGLLVFVLAGMISTTIIGGPPASPGARSCSQFWWPRS